MNPAGPLRVTVVYSPGPRTVDEQTLSLPLGSTVGSAIAASGLLVKYSELSDASLLLGIWGRKALQDTPLRDADRVEVYRALKVDPKVARRERFVKQGVKKAGLFAQRRAGAKPGY
jgi:uncharacterized protein